MFISDMLSLCQVSSGDLFLSAYNKLCHARPGNFRLGLGMHFHFRLVNVSPGW
jgi:hypothetical protein